MPRREEVWLRDMRDAARRARSYAASLNFAGFAADEMRVDATVRQLEILGEACKSVSDATKLRHPDVAWRILARTRDRLIHAYFSVDARAVWDMVEEDLPTLIAQLEAILNPQPQGDTQGEHNGPTH